MKKLPIILLLLLNITITHADENEGVIPKLLQYDVEVIIFEDANARYINSEDWQHKDAAAIPAAEVVIEPVENIDTSPENLDKLSIDEINAIDGVVSTTPFENIQPVILNKEYQRINNSKEYNVLFYGSWRQDGLAAEKTFEIDLQDLTNAHASTSENSLSGNFKLVLARYLHIYSKLDYKRKLQTEAPTIENTEITTSTQEADKQETSAPAFEIYPINNHRRMRSKELHYIDHPLVSMIIQINPVKSSEESTAE